MPFPTFLTYSPSQRMEAAAKGARKLALRKGVASLMPETFEPVAPPICEGHLRLALRKGTALAVPDKARVSGVLTPEGAWE